jgi:hypothetical protein
MLAMPRFETAWSPVEFFDCVFNFSLHVLRRSTADKLGTEDEEIRVQPRQLAYFDPEYSGQYYEMEG